MDSEQPIIFEGPTGSLQLRVERYQFPEIENEAWDSDWLMIAGDVLIDGRSWRFLDPCLTTFEMARLATWLEQVIAGTADRICCGFIEPNLDFERVSDQSIRISFSLEAAPPWAKRDADLSDTSFTIAIDDGLLRAASRVRAYLVRFPVRVPMND